MSIDCLVKLCVVKVYLDTAICLPVGTNTINRNNPLARLVIQYGHVIEFIQFPLAYFFHNWQRYSLRSGQAMYGPFIRCLCARPLDCLGFQRAADLQRLRLPQI